MTILLALGALACQSTTGSGVRIVQPGAPGAESTVVGPAPAAANRHTAADVRFMKGMIGHHAQALEMVALLPARTSRDGMKLLAKRIEVSQTDEIKLMQDWLRARGETPPDAHAHHLPGATLMPGMLTAEEMSSLTAATGVEFDRLFLQLMIKHHDGALVMVKELFGSAGAGQDSEIFAFASDVEADQAMEIQRMRMLLKELSR